MTQIVRVGPCFVRSGSAFKNHDTLLTAAVTDTGQWGDAYIQSLNIIAALNYDTMVQWPHSIWVS